MAKSNDIPLQRKVDVVIGLLSLIGAERVDTDNPSMLIAAKSTDKELAKAVVVATDYAIEHLEFIRTWLSN
ncbi:MAG: hypothetical protein K2J16_02565 [Clostridia bacterium]|nr:hypothetical protein [Clostridia bacterium]